MKKMNKILDYYKGNKNSKTENKFSEHIQLYLTLFSVVFARIIRKWKVLSKEIAEANNFKIFTGKLKKAFYFKLKSFAFVIELKLHEYQGQSF